VEVRHHEEKRELSVVGQRPDLPVVPEARVDLAADFGDREQLDRRIAISEIGAS